ncbi:hypothetical protein [Olsenella phocaeensis]|uniref:hypothetical protein n=1 Tax=Olsenella phocaeensis TaxID=1852385 RepID=UPI000930CF16|nr:hypothetical protein [Olsenella phocaeensis]
MKRDRLRELLGEAATDELVDAIMAANGKDIESAKSASASLRDEVSTLREENEQLKAQSTSTMTEAERMQRAIEEANARAAKATRELSEASAAAVFAAAGISEDEYRAFLPSVVSDDRKASVAAAKAIADMVSAKVTAAADAATKDALGKMTPPAGGEPSGDGTPRTRAEFLGLPYQQQVSLKAQDPEIMSKLTD